MKPLFREFTTTEEIDAQYRVAASTEAIIQARKRAATLSEDARRSLHHVQNIAYGPSPAEYLDIFPAGENAPVFVFFHGGYWRAMSAGDYSFVARGPVARGVLTVSVNYGLAPQLGLDAIVGQAKAAIAWVFRNIHRYGGDPHRIVTGGHSAGAQLAAMCLLTDWARDFALPADFLRAALLISGVFELEPLRYSFLQPDLRFDDGLIARNSPAGMLNRKGAPVLLTIGARESPEFHRQSRDFQATWGRSGNSSLLEIVDRADHFQAVEPLRDPSSTMCRWIEENAI